MKKLFCFSIVPLFLGILSCSSYNLKIPESEFKKSIKTIVVLPIYIGNDIFPDIPQNSPAYKFTDDEKKAVLEILNSNRDIFVQPVVRIFETGNYILTVKKIDINNKELMAGINKIPSSLFLTQSGKKNIVFEYNKALQLKQDKVAEIAKKYNADAVFFHYLNINAIWYQNRWTTTGYKTVTTYTLTLPRMSLLHSGILYSRDGSVLLNSFDEQRQFTSANYSTIYGGFDTSYEYLYFDDIINKDNKNLVIKKIFPKMKEDISKIINNETITKKLNNSYDFLRGFIKN